MSGQFLELAEMRLGQGLGSSLDVLQQRQQRCQRSVIQGITAVGQDGIHLGPLQDISKNLQRQAGDADGVEAARLSAFKAYEMAGIQPGDPVSSPVSIRCLLPSLSITKT